MPAVRFETEHLIIRSWKWRDIFPIRTWGSDPLVACSAGWKPITSLYEAFLRIRYGYDKRLCFALEDKQSGRAIGSLSFMDGRNGHIPLCRTELEMGYWIARPWWGKGYLCEAAMPVLDYYFSHGIQRIWCVTDPANHQSLRVQEKLGFRYNRAENISVNHSGSSLVQVLDCQDWRFLS